MKRMALDLEVIQPRFELMEGCEHGREENAIVKLKNVSLRGEILWFKFVIQSTFKAGWSQLVFCGYMTCQVAWWYTTQKRHKIGQNT